jgi:hypothetical protein
MKTIRVRAASTGRVVCWRSFARGTIVEPTFWQRVVRLTTTLPDVMIDVIEAASSRDSSMKLTCIVPNGPTTAQLDISIIGEGFEMVCSRRLVRGWFPLNPFAAEFGSNYDIILSADGDSRFVFDLLRLLGSRYQVTHISHAHHAESEMHAPAPLSI